MIVVLPMSKPLLTFVSEIEVIPNGIGINTVTKINTKNPRVIHRFPFFFSFITFFFLFYFSFSLEVSSLAGIGIFFIETNRRTMNAITTARMPLMLIAEFEKTTLQASIFLRSNWSYRCDHTLVCRPKFDELFEARNLAGGGRTDVECCNEGKNNCHKSINSNYNSEEREDLISLGSCGSLHLQSRSVNQYEMVQYRRCYSAIFNVHSLK